MQTAGLFEGGIFRELAAASSGRSIQANPATMLDKKMILSKFKNVF
jgi:hypothetical protein